VREDVGAAIVLLDESEAFFRIEPLHGTDGHAFSPYVGRLGAAVCATLVAEMTHPGSAGKQNAPEGLYAVRRALSFMGANCNCAKASTGSMDGVRSSRMSRK
jgi:hypothetical protein